MQERDLLKMTTVYLKLWKLCDLVLQHSNVQESSKFLEIAYVDEHAVIKELEKYEQSGLAWADNSSLLADEIKDTLGLARKQVKSEGDFAVLSSYRTRFQEKALHYSGELEMVSGQGT